MSHFKTTPLTEAFKAAQKRNEENRQRLMDDVLSFVSKGEWTPLSLAQFVASRQSELEEKAAKEVKAEEHAMPLANDGLAGGAERPQRPRNVLPIRDLIQEARSLIGAFERNQQEPHIVSAEVELPLGVNVFYFPEEIHADVKAVLKRAYIKCLTMAIGWAVLQDPTVAEDDPEPEPVPLPAEAPQLSFNCPRCGAESGYVIGLSCNCEEAAELFKNLPEVFTKPKSAE